jgi:hypothetical protein
LRVEKLACSIGNCNGQLCRAVEGVFIELSQETSHWTQIQILDNVQGGGQCPTGPDIVRLEVIQSGVSLKCI